MKKKFIDYLKLSILFFGVSITIFNCEKEETSTEDIQKQNLFSIKKIEAQEIDTDIKLLTSLKALTKKEITKDNTQNKFVSSNGSNFYINTNQAIYIENGSYNSYTFSIYRENNEDLLENLFLSLQEDGNYKASIIQYGIGNDGVSISNDSYYNVIELGSNFNSKNIISELSKDGGCVFDYATSLGPNNVEYETTEDCEAENGAGACDRVVIHYVHNACPNVIAAVPGASSGDTVGSTNSGSTTSGNSGVSYINYNGTNYNNTNNTNNNNLPIGAGNINNTNTVINTTTTLVNKAYYIIKSLPNLTEVQKIWLSTFADTNTIDAITNFLIENNSSDEAEDFANELITIISQETIIDQNALSFILEAKTQDKFYNELDSEFLISVNDYMVIDTQNNEYTDPLYLNFMMRCIALRVLHPDWSNIKIYWEASKDFVHLSLDILGLVPVFGEPADIINGVIYTFEGEALNASLSYAGAIPFVGWLSTGAKVSIKVINQTTQGVIGLVWKVTDNGLITFGNRNILKHVIGSAGTGLHAHHIIPWAKSSKDIIQKSANSASHFNMNSLLNGIPLPPSQHLVGHSIYSNKVDEILDVLHYDGMHPDDAYNAWRGLLII